MHGKFNQQYQLASKDTDEEPIMYSKSGTTEITIYDEADELIQETFYSLVKRYQVGLKISMKGSNFIFDCVNLIRCICHKKI